MDFDNTHNIARIRSSHNGSGGNAVSRPLGFFIGSSEKVRLHDDGEVSIGTTILGHASADDLTINNSGNGGITIRNGTTSNGAIFFADSTTGDARFDGFVQYNHGTDPYMLFGTAGDERLRIRSDGNINAQKSLAVGGITTSTDYDLSAIDKDISDTATDVFVYDTRKDSDGGAWRNRTSHTSWYNETLNTSTRGARKEFPAVAVIVCFTNGLAIYDGDDPNLPLWMKWTSTNGTYMLRGTTSGRIAAMNGIIAVSNASTYGGMVAIYFISDTSRSYRQLGSNNSSEGYFIGNGIVARNDFSANCYSNTGGGNTLPSLVDEDTKDVAITVLPNAPVDPDTGLPIPTIALATIGGTSIIKDDGTVVDIVYGSGASPSTAYVDFRKSDNAIVMSMNSNGSYVHVIYDIPTSDISGSHQYQKEAIDDEFYRTGSSSDWNQDVWIYAASPYGGTTVRIVNNVISGNGGINVLSPSRTAPATDTMVARITSSFNSGYMHGDIKGAFLSDTDTTNITDTQAVTNPGPFTSTTGWTAANAGWSISDSSNRLVINSGSQTGSYFGASQTLTLVDGRKYVLVVNIHSQTKTAVIRLTADGNYFTETGLGTGEHSFYFTANQASHSIFIGSDTGGTNREQQVSSVTIREVEEDRSKDNKGLQVFGTITKSAVATGAELVSYGPFSTTNRLRQTYNSDLNFETNDFSIMLWMYNTGTNIHQTLVGRDNREFSVDILDNTSYSRRFRIYAYDSSNSMNSFDSNDDPFPVNSWSHVCVNYTGGNTATIYVNGILNKTGTLNYDIDDTSNGLNIGARNTSGSYAHAADGTKLALVRISKGAPSTEKIKKIYNDEKHLFNVNAKATLYGSSDAVTALAFDDSHDILHVGTSAGRSEFRGLNRINNTTTAVTTAISASNELVAEQ